MNEEVLIPINDKYRIINGEINSFVLQESYHSEKDNTVLWRNSGYFSDVKTCLYSLLRRMPIEQGDTLKTYTERMGEWYKFLFIEKQGEIHEKALRR